MKLPTLDEFMFWLAVRERRLRLGKTVFQCYSHTARGAMNVAH